jgi:hypothetical protein
MFDEVYEWAQGDFQGNLNYTDYMDFEPASSEEFGSEEFACA